MTFIEPSREELKMLAAASLLIVEMSFTTFPIPARRNHRKRSTRTSRAICWQQHGWNRRALCWKLSGFTGDDRGTPGDDLTGYLTPSAFITLQSSLFATHQCKAVLYLRMTSDMSHIQLSVSMIRTHDLSTTSNPRATRKPAWWKPST